MSETTATWAYWVYPLLSASFFLAIIVLVDSEHLWSAPGDAPKYKDWGNTSLFWGGFSAYLSILFTVLKDVYWLLFLSGIFFLVAFWPVANAKAKTKGGRLLLMCAGVIVMGSFLVYLDHKIRPQLNCSLALVTTIHRMRDPNGGYMRGGQNDLVGVLRIRQKNGLSVRHISSLRVVGNVSADFGSYLSAFAKGDGTESTDQLEQTFMSSKPFFHLSWIIHPESHARVDPTDEEFIRFTISRSGGFVDMLHDPKVGSVKDYFGFEATGKRPKYSMTSPVWSHLVEFSDVNRSDLTGIYPRLRSEVKTGIVEIQVDIDGEIIDIPVGNISFPWAVSLSDNVHALPEDLFYGVENGGELNSLPSTVNPLIEKEQF